MLFKPMDMATKMENGKVPINKEQTDAQHYKKGRRGLTTEENIEQQRRLDFASAEDLVSAGLQPLEPRKVSETMPSPTLGRNNSN
jgi:hypothetical protein